MTHTSEASSEIQIAAPSKPWDGLGYEIKRGDTMEDIIANAGLDWPLEKNPIFWSDLGVDRKVESHQLLVKRMEEEAVPLGICGHDYEEKQNSAIVNYFRQIAEHAGCKARIVGALESYRGLYVWVAASSDKGFRLSQDDAMRAHLLMSFPHIYGEGMRTRVLFIHKSNVTYATKPLPSTKAFRLGVDLDSIELLQAERLKVGLEVETAAMTAKAEILANAKVRLDDLTMYVAQLFAPHMISPEKTIDVRKLRHNSLTALRTSMESLRGEQPTIANTWWGAFLGICRTTDIELAKGRRRDFALHSIWFSQSAVLKSKALDLALEYAKKS